MKFPFGSLMYYVSPVNGEKHFAYTFETIMERLLYSLSTQNGQLGLGTISLKK